MDGEERVPRDEELLRFRAEAAELLGIPAKAVVANDENPEKPLKVEAAKKGKPDEPVKEETVPAKKPVKQ